MSILPQHFPEILRIKPSVTRVTDSYMWLASKSGTYSAKSGYYAATTMETEAPIENQRTFKTIWNRKTSPKLQLFLWKVVQGALVLGENLAKRGLMANVACRYCGEIETSEHIFLHCYHTRQIWSNTIWTSNFNPANCDSFSEAFLASGSSIMLPPWGLVGDIFPWIVWGIWTARNLYIFENRVLTPVEILTKAIRSEKEWHQARASITQPRPSLTHSRLWLDLHLPTERPTAPGYGDILEYIFSPSS
ncbi:hypothetical protein Bca52824_072389 [Brassica carinata]|uniref:Reverse transcriptase zinc-binding domain-containing protein n=1 Tax=Brassica carinata TaxID=52824 RepID=A0A8X7Q817_BRACI|nr:hypothetical protein Bca52824_072389 [Brassica carinata]